jgi:hypothetical protein
MSFYKTTIVVEAISTTYLCVWGGGGRGVCLRAFRHTYPVCHAQAPYCLRPLWFHYIYRRYLIDGTIFGKKSQNIICVFWFYLQLLLETFLIIRRNKRDFVINVKTSSCKVTDILSDFNETLIFSIDFRKKVSNLKFNQNPSSGSRFVPCGQTDGRTNIRRPIVAFRILRTRLKFNTNYI